MSRQSLRKVKLTSKFEEFSSTRLASIQRLAHNDANNSQNDATANNISDAAPAPAPAPAPTTRSERIAAAAAAAVKVEPKPVETPKTPMTPSNHVPTKERTPHKVLRHKVAPVTPATPAYEIPTPTHPYHHMTPLPKLTANGKIRGRPRKCWQKAETVVKPVTTAREEVFRLREENASLKLQLEQKAADFEELKRQSSYTGETVPKIDYEDLKDKYQRDMISAKRREWCVVCLNPSRYYCCWNTTYCSQKCQVSDWYQRHMKSCERRRGLKTATT